MTIQRALAFVLSLLLLPLAAQAQSFPKLTGRVVDAANLLSPEQEAQITQLSSEVEQASSRQFVVATIPDLGGYDIADYGYRLGRAWKIGQSEANNGILLIVAPTERKVRIEVGYGLEPIMTDALSSTIINETIIPRFKAGDMGGGVVAGAQAVGEQMKLPLEAAEQRAQQAAQQQAKAAPRQARSGGGRVPWGLIFWGVILVFVILPMLFGGRRGRKGSRRYRGRGDGGALPIILWSIASEMSRGGGSGWGGGGGDWGGGGGGGFGGGGGSFGGGGASGSW